MAVSARLGCTYDQATEVDQTRKISPPLKPYGFGLIETFNRLAEAGSHDRTVGLLVSFAPDRGIAPQLARPNFGNNGGPTQATRMVTTFHFTASQRTERRSDFVAAFATRANEFGG